MARDHSRPAYKRGARGGRALRVARDQLIVVLLRREIERVLRIESPSSKSASSSSTPNRSVPRGLSKQIRRRRRPRGSGSLSPSPEIEPRNPARAGDEARLIAVGGGGGGRRRHRDLCARSTEVRGTLSIHRRPTSQQVSGERPRRAFDALPTLTGRSHARCNAPIGGPAGAAAQHTAVQDSRCIRWRRRFSTFSPLRRHTIGRRAPEMLLRTAHVYRRTRWIACGHDRSEPWTRGPARGQVVALTRT